MIYEGLLLLLEISVLAAQLLKTWAGKAQPIII